MTRADVKRQRLRIHRAAAATAVVGLMLGGGQLVVIIEQLGTLDRQHALSLDFGRLGWRAARAA